MATIDSPPEVDYSNPHVPDWYTCGDCDAKGVKLWRPRHEWGSPPSELRCANCAAKDQQITLSDMQPGGMHKINGALTDTIGTYFPAVPRNRPKDGDDGGIGESFYWY